jgi:transaldolase
MHRLFTDHGQSPWLDNLSRRDLRDGTLRRMVAAGIRGVTANPTILARAIEGSDAYNGQFATLMAEDRSVVEAYWALVVDDALEALEIFRPLYERSGGGDGFVSVEVAPELAHDAAASVAAARALHERIDRPNLLVKVPATREGVEAVEALTAEGRSINVTLIFSLSRYDEVVEAYVGGLEQLVERGGDPSTVHSVASFFVSRVDVEVDRQLATIGTDQTLLLSGLAGVAQAKLAYQMFLERFSGWRWDRLAALGANVQRPLWASTSTKNPAYRDTLYVDELIGRDTVNTVPESTIKAFDDHGTLAARLGADVERAQGVLRLLATVGVDMDNVGTTLEEEAIDAFRRSNAEVLSALDEKARQLAYR